MLVHHISRCLRQRSAQQINRHKFSECNEGGVSWEITGPRGDTAANQQRRACARSPNLGVHIDAICREHACSGTPGVGVWALPQAG
jgi:hypothetical protein